MAKRISKRNGRRNGQYEPDDKAGSEDAGADGKDAGRDGNKNFSAEVGGGAVSATVNGKKELQEIILKEEAVDPDDIEMLQDLIVAAVNEAMRKADKDSETQMNSLTGGINIPGLM